MSKLFEPFQSKKLQLQNHIAMAPMTRSRAIGNVPNDMMATYYAIRADTGLIITEGTAPSKNGLGYTNIPGIYSEEQIRGWKKVTDAVHDKGGKIFIQLMHVGRVAHQLNLPEGGEIVAPSAIQASGEMFTVEGPKPHNTPKAMSQKDILQAQDEFVQAAKNAITAGFDGVEIHAANGYLPNQFLNTQSNIRTDDYGGNIENRCRFVVEIAKKIAHAIGSGKTGIRLSPYGVFNDMALYDEIPQTYTYLVKELATLDLAYLHLVNLSQWTKVEIPEGFMETLAETFGGSVMFNGGLGYNIPAAEKLLEASDKYLVSIGVPFISNPDLITRLKTGAELAPADQSTFYTPGEEGYLTYPVLKTQNT